MSVTRGTALRRAASATPVLNSAATEWLPAFGASCAVDAGAHLSGTH